MCTTRVCLERVHGCKRCKTTPVESTKRFQRFGILRNFCAGVSTYLGYALGLLRVTSLPGVYPNPPFGLILDSTGDCLSLFVTGVTAASSGTHTHTLVQKTGVSPVRRHWRAQQRDLSIPEGSRRDTGRGLRDAFPLRASIASVHVPFEPTLPDY